MTKYVAAAVVFVAVVKVLEVVTVVAVGDDCTASCCRKLDIALVSVVAVVARVTDFVKASDVVAADANVVAVAELPTMQRCYFA